MAFNANAPADNQFLSDFPPEMREQLRAIVEDAIVNALKLAGRNAGNANGNIPINNGNLNANLNADLLDGHDATYFSADGHVHAVATQSSDGFMSNADKTKLDSIATNAEVNQNAFANVTVGSVTIQADGKQDTLTFQAGPGISITPDATNDKVTIAAADGVYLPLSGGTLTGIVKRNGNAVSAVSDDSYTRFMGGTTDTAGAGLTLGGKDHSWAGKWELKAHNGTNSKVLVGTAAGVLTWGGYNVCVFNSNGQIVFPNGNILWIS